MTAFGARHLRLALAAKKQVGARGTMSGCEHALLPSPKPAFAGHLAIGAEVTTPDPKQPGCKTHDWSDQGPVCAGCSCRFDSHEEAPRAKQDIEGQCEPAGGDGCGGGPGAANSRGFGRARRPPRGEETPDRSLIHISRSIVDPDLHTGHDSEWRHVESLTRWAGSTHQRRKADADTCHMREESSSDIIRA